MRESDGGNMFERIKNTRNSIGHPALLSCAVALGAICIHALVPSTALAQTNFSGAGSAGAQFLKIGVGARYLAMGEASVALGGDAFSLYWNPAALTEIEGDQLALAHNNWVLDISLNYAAYAHRIEGFGVLAVGVTALSVPDDEVTTVTQQDGNGLFFNANSYAVTLGFARELTPRFAFGGSFKYINESIFTENASGVGFDLGTMLQTGLRNLRLGMNITNLGSELRFDGPNLRVQVPSGNSINDAQLTVESFGLPLIFRVGVAYDVQLAPQQRLTLASELKHPNDNIQQGGVGLEYGYNERFFLRSGYKINYDEEDLTLGAGLQTPFGKESNLTIDYAWVDLGRLNSTHRFSFNVSF
ncbi:MAG: PorV/PorQ family protein [Candidatus Zixiibacteriota bacterium]